MVIENWSKLGAAELAVIGEMAQINKSVNNPPLHYKKWSFGVLLGCKESEAPKMSGMSVNFSKSWPVNGYGCEVVAKMRGKKTARRQKPSFIHAPRFDFYSISSSLEKLCRFSRQLPISTIPAFVCFFAIFRWCRQSTIFSHSTNVSFHFWFRLPSQVKTWRRVIVGLSL